MGLNFPHIPDVSTVSTLKLAEVEQPGNKSPCLGAGGGGLNNVVLMGWPTPQRWSRTARSLLKATLMDGG
jgi:hypothetical protein